MSIWLELCLSTSKSWLWRLRRNRMLNESFFKLFYRKFVFKIILFRCYRLSLRTKTIFSCWSQRMIGVNAKLLSGNFRWRIYQVHNLIMWNRLSFSNSSLLSWFNLLLSRLSKVFKHNSVVFIWTYVDKIFNFIIIQILIVPEIVRIWRRLARNAWIIRKWIFIYS